MGIVITANAQGMCIVNCYSIVLYGDLVHEIGRAGADPGFQVRGGGALKKIAPSGGRREHFWGISCEKSRFYAKKITFFPILGGREICGVFRPLLEPPLGC